VAAKKRSSDRAGTSSAKGFCFFLVFGLGGCRFSREGKKESFEGEGCQRLKVSESLLQGVLGRRTAGTRDNGAAANGGWEPASLPTTL